MVEVNEIKILTNKKAKDIKGAAIIEDKVYEVKQLEESEIKKTEDNK